MFNLTFYIIVKFSFIYSFQNPIENLITRFKKNINQYKDIFCKSESQKRKSEIKVLE